MTVIFMSFSRNEKRSRKRKTEITGKYNRKTLADGGLNKQGEEKNRVPDTAHDCPILRIGVKQAVPAPQNHRHLHFDLIT